MPSRTLVSVELVFDDAADAAVRAEWAALSEAGLPSQADHTGATNRPHITLLVRPELGLLDGDAALAPRLPMPLTLGAPVLFGRSRHRVLARLVIPSAPLLEMHAAVHVLAGQGADADRTVPGAWTPHVTLSRRLPVDRVGEALGVLADGGRQDITAAAVGVRRWDAALRTVSNVAGHGSVDPC